MTSHSKQSLDDFAVFGAAPLFPSPMHVGRPNLGNIQRFHARVDQVFYRNWLTNDGPLVREFEEKIADLTKVKYCIAVSNGTAALEVAVRALNLTGEVIVPSFTFVASVHALAWQGLTPVFCDIQPDTFHLDPDQIESLITRRTSAILPVHVWGVPCDIDAISEIAHRHNLRLIYDASHALACSYQGIPIGGFGDVETFSFHSTKFVNSFEGGCLLTNDQTVAERSRLMRNFGFEWYDKVVSIGTNAKMDEVRAAMGLTSLESMDQFISRNQDNYQSYRSGLADISGITLYQYPSNCQVNFQYVVATIDAGKFGLSRDQIVSILTAENIFARRYFYPGCHRMEPYGTLVSDAGRRLPETETQAERVMLLPTGMQILPDQVSQICSLLRKVSQFAPDIAARLNRSSFMESRHLLEKSVPRRDDAG